MQKPIVLNVRVGPDTPRGWVAILLARIDRLGGVSITVDRNAAASRRSYGPAVLLGMEALLERRGLTAWTARTHLPSTVERGTRLGRPDDLVLDLLGGAVETPGTRVWTLAFDGRAGDDALLAALFAGRTPVVTLTESGRILASARVGTESHGDLLTAFEDGLARTTTLIVAALSGIGSSVPPPDAPRATDPVALSARAIHRHVIAKARRKIGSGLGRLRYRSPHWRVGWRRVGASDTIDRGALPETGWTDLSDDGSRFYADPFPIEQAGRTVLFVEDFVYRRGKAIISAVTFGPEGPTGPPVPVLEEPYHLSYPFVFARDGEHWLVPESCANGTVDLYRATAFPGGWIKEATLLSGIVASDATLVEHCGRWWMFATVRDRVTGMAGLAPRGSYSDALHLWSAPDFRGPWQPHPKNPVLIDIASARPAGRIVARAGGLVRPVQDCRLGYGAALSLARIDRLDDDAYAQTVTATLRPGPSWPGTCLHTLNRTGTFEFIDGCGRSPRFGRRPGPTVSR